MQAYKHVYVIGSATNGVNKMPSVLTCASQIMV